MNAAIDRVSELHLHLVEETDDLSRARMHLELATLAVRDGKLDSATRHFREALLFDATLERARLGLEELGDLARSRPRIAPRGLLRGLLHRLRGGPRA